jgi:hypothetical protein
MKDLIGWEWSDIRSHLDDEYRSQRGIFEMTERPIEDILFDTVKRAGKEYYTHLHSGHVGYMREAIRRTPGTYEGRRGWGNGSPGMNTTITIGFPSRDVELYRQLMTNYHAVIDEKAAERRAKKLNK